MQTARTTKTDPVKTQRLRMDATGIVRYSKIAAIAVDSDGLLLACNEAADEIFGHDRRQIVGRDFSQVFRPRDIFNNPLVHNSTLFQGLLEEGSAIRNFQCNLRKASGNYQRTAVSVVVVIGPTPSSFQLVYMLWPALRRRKADEVIARLLNGAGYSDSAGVGEDLRAGTQVSSVLTNRQVQVLRMVAGGEATEAIASTLCISPETVRNHVRNIIARLGVHNRVEAVSVAHKRHLL